MIAILDYEAGNLTSVKRALDKLGLPSIITARPEDVAGAERIIFPGVGAAGATMRALRDSGLGEALTEAVEAGKPVLGICVGCQIIMDSSEENQTACLGLLPGCVKAFPRPLMDAEGNRLKVPHMGWNEVRFIRPHPLFDGVPEGSEFYFVHSYYPEPSRKDVVFGECDYGLTFAAAVGRDNLMALQFHTEKSGRPGLKILDNFARWRP